MQISKKQFQEEVFAALEEANLHPGWAEASYVIGRLWKFIEKSEDQEMNVKMSDCTSELGTVCTDAACPVHKVIPRETIREAELRSLLGRFTHSESCQAHHPDDRIADEDCDCWRKALLEILDRKVEAVPPVWVEPVNASEFLSNPSFDRLRKFCEKTWPDAVEANMLHIIKGWAQ